MHSLFHLILLAKLTRLRYSANVPEKKGNKFSSLNFTKAHKPRNAVFLRAYVIAHLLWAAMAGSLRAAGFLCVRSANPAICCPPRLAVGRSVTTTQRSHHD
jgi:hypothetical protein